MTKANYWVTQKNGDWQAKKEGSSRASGIFEKQSQAESFARKIMQSNGGGELVTQDRHGKIRSKDTINSYDPRSIKDMEY